ncbi:hypothetical protein FRZ44_30980 [Hypericibacter terrae]|uniref:Uncharacterized protein n=1 Tax=Hypericibacter terrae TaxID=2602015 RepID=A0A5J6MMN3_9PROT|nr:hypothetical protein FRZ44_30980 [Hypericibacter terrae]
MHQQEADQAYAEQHRHQLQGTPENEAISAHAREVIPVIRVRKALAAILSAFPVALQGARSLSDKTEGGDPVRGRRPHAASAPLSW